MAENGINKELEQLDIKSEVESLTIHGIPRIASSHSIPLKLIWLCLCLFASTVLIICAATSVSRHFRREVYTNIEKVQKKSVALPAVTFCNANSINHEPPSEANYSYPEKQDLPENCSFIDKKYFKNEINRQYFIQACRWFFGNHSFAEMENVARIGRYKHEVIEFPKHFSFDPNIWPCFTLNSNQVLQQYEAGERAGIRMILYSDDENYSQRKIWDPLDDDNQGLFLTIQDGREHMNGFSRINLPIGFHTSIEIKKIVTTQKPAPFPSDCLENGKTNGLYIFPGKQTLDNCRLSCFHTLIHKRCGGVYPPMRTFMKQEEYPGFINISVTKSAQCLRDVVNNMTECDCRVPCEMESYETKVSRIPWPRELIENQLYTLLYKDNSQNKTLIKTKLKYLLKVSIYYNSLCEFVHTEEEKYDSISILSDFGGQMGLLIGASCLSFVEIIMVVGSYIIYSARTAKQRFLR